MEVHGRRQPAADDRLCRCEPVFRPLGIHPGVRAWEPRDASRRFLSRTYRANLPGLPVLFIAYSSRILLSLHQAQVSGHSHLQLGEDASRNNGSVSSHLDASLGSTSRAGVESPGVESFGGSFLLYFASLRAA